MLRALLHTIHRTLQITTGLNGPIACTVANNRLYVTSFEQTTQIVCALDAIGNPTGCTSVGFPIGSPVGIVIKI